jgi:hypothetical protein
MADDHAEDQDLEDQDLEDQDLAPETRRTLADAFMEHLPPEFAKIQSGLIRRVATSASPSLGTYAADLRAAAMSQAALALGAYAADMFTDAMRQTAVALAPDVPRLFKQLTEQLDIPVPAQVYPPNWMDVPDPPAVKARRGLEVAAQGVPLAWVPRGSIVRELVNVGASDRANITVEHHDDILDDCMNAVAPLVGGENNDLAILLGAAIDAVRGGHEQAGQALAVCVFDSLLKKLKPERKYAQWQKLVDTRGRLPIHQYRTMVAFAPLRSVLVDWWPNKGDPKPEDFNRHVTIHGASLDQYTRWHALLAVMVAASLLLHGYHADRPTPANPATSTGVV